MKICFVVGEFPALSHTFVLDQVAALKALGHDVRVVCDRIGSDARIDRQAEPLRSLMGATERWWGAPEAVRAGIGRLPGRLRDKVSTAADMFWNGSINDCDVVVAHFGGNGLRLARAKKRGRLAPPIVTIFHGNDVGLHHHSGTLGIYRPLFEHGALHLTVNGMFRRLLIEAGARPAATAVHHMGIDCAGIRYRWRPWQAGPLELVSVCRLVEKKGIADALRAVALLRERRPHLDWRYTVIGDGPLAAPLQSLSAELGLSGHVHFAGALPHAEVKARLSAAHVFFLPSVTASDGDLEGIPVALMEAAAAGLVVVSTRHSGIPELIEDRVGGFLADERDVGALASALTTIAGDHAACRPLTLAARARVEEGFDNAVLHPRFCGLLAPLAAGKRAA